MRRIAAVVVCIAALLGSPLPAAPASAGGESGGTLVGEQPVAGTPQVLDGEVLAIVQVGSTIVLGGSFTRARDDGSDVELARRGLLAFDATTGRIDPGFHPDPDGAVNALAVGRAGTVYVGGEFAWIGGLPRPGLARVGLAGGTVVPGFDAGRVDGPVRDLELRSTRLWVAGAFTRIGGRKRRALAVLNAGSGRARSKPAPAIAGRARHGLGRTAVSRIDVSPNGRYLALIGNFRSVQGERRAQLAVLDLRRAAAVTSFRTRFYAAECSSLFFSYVRDVDFAPDGSYFVVATSGGPGGAGSPCDTVARFETRGTDRAARPSWVASTGGDTLQAVEVTAAAVYVGGHQRWFNNPYGANTPGPGAVARDGIAALSPVNGLPFSWNPGRSRGVGVGDLLATGAGLWVGSDTDRIGDQVRARIALLPAGGSSYPPLSTPGRRASAYNARGSDLVRRSLRGSRAGPASTAPSGGQDWSTVAGAFLLAGRLYVAGRDGSFTRRTFDGATYGPPEPVVAAGGVLPLPAWQAELASVTGMFYDRGRIYFTLAGSRALHYRYFNPESGIVGAERLVASRRVGGFAPRRVRGMFVAGKHLYWVTGSGRMRRTGWTRTAQSGVPSGEVSDVHGSRWGRGVVFATAPVRRGG